MDIQTKDGIVLRNIPDDTPEEAIKARIAKIRSEGAVGARANAAGAVAEPIMNMISGMVAKPISEVAGLAATAKDLITGNKEGNPQGFKESVQDALTYSPRTPAGKAVTESPYNPVNIIGNAVNSVATGAGNFARGDDPGPLRSAFGNAIQEAVPQAVGLVGASSIPVPKILTNNPVTRGFQHLFEKTDTRSARLADAAAGDLSPQLIARLRQPDLPAGTVGEIVSGIGSAETSALQKLAGDRYMPSQYSTKAKNLGADLVKELQTIGGRGADNVAFDKAVADRATVTAPHYAAVEKSTAKVKAAPVMQEISQALMKSPNETAITVPLNQLREKLTVQTPRGVALETNPQALSSLSKEVKRMIDSKTPTGSPEYNVKVLTDIKDNLDTQIAKAVPDYGVARQTFADMSDTPNKMSVGKYLEDKLVPALAELGDPNVAPAQMLRAPAFAQAMRDGAGTVKAATGFSRGDLAKVLGDQMPIAEGVGAALDRTFTNKQLASQGNKAIARILGENVNELPIPPTLSQPIAVLKAIKNRLQGNASEASLKQVAQIMLNNPAKYADLLESASAKNKQALAAYLMNPRLLMTAPDQSQRVQE